MLPYYDVDRSQVQILGPVAVGVAVQRVRSGCRARGMRRPIRRRGRGWSKAMRRNMAAPPPAVADLAFDAASIARVLGASGGFSIAALTQPAGFIGADGWLALLPDGQVRRGLAVFRVQRGGPEMIEPAPQSAEGTGADS